MPTPGIPQFQAGFRSIDGSLLNQLAGVARATLGDNVWTGVGALNGLTTGDGNTGIGYYAGASVTTGGGNTFLGDNAGNNVSQKVDADNSTAIGAGAFTTASNQVVVGNASVTGTILRGVVAVGPTIAVVAGGTSTAALTLTTGAVGVYVGSGAPTISAAQGSLYLRTDGSSTSTRLYVNTDGTTGWAAVTTAS